LPISDLRLYSAMSLFKAVPAILQPGLERSCFGTKDDDNWHDDKACPSGTKASKEFRKQKDLPIHLLFRMTSSGSHVIFPLT